MFVNALLEFCGLIRETDQFIEVCGYVPLSRRPIGNLTLHPFAVLHELPVRIVPFFCPLSCSEDLSEEFLILQGIVPDHFVNLDLMVSQVVVRAIHTVVGLTIAFRFELTEKGGFHPRTTVAEARTIVRLDEGNVRGAW